jgi:Ras-related protein Rab-7A
LVYDITNEKSFDQLNTCRQDFLNQANPKDPENFPFVVMGNKVDKEPERRVAKSKATQWCKSKGDKTIPYFESSAKDGVKVDDAFLEVAKSALLTNPPETQVYIPETISLTGGGGAGAKSSSCC